MIYWIMLWIPLDDLSHPFLVSRGAQFPYPLPFLLPHCRPKAKEQAKSRGLCLRKANTNGIDTPNTCQPDQHGAYAFCFEEMKWSPVQRKRDDTRHAEEVGHPSSARGMIPVKRKRDDTRQDGNENTHTHINQLLFV
jgi:hypothetical protein